MGNRSLIEGISGGQSDKFWTTGRHSVNGPNHRWVYCNYPIILLIFSLLSLLVFVFLIFFLSLFSLLLFSFSLTPHSLSASIDQPLRRPLLFNLLQWVWSTFSFLIHSLLVLFVGIDFGLNGSGFRLQSTMRMRNKKITKLGSGRSRFRLDGG